MYNTQIYSPLGADAAKEDHCWITIELSTHNLTRSMCGLALSDWGIDMWNVYCCARDGRTKPTQRTPNERFVSDASGVLVVVAADQSTVGLITEDDTGLPAPKSFVTVFSSES